RELRRRLRLLEPTAAHASLAGIFIVPTEPVQRVVRGTRRLVSPPRCPVEPLVHAPETVQPARVGRVGVVHDAILERERAHTRTLPRVRQPVRTDRACPCGEWPLVACPGRRRVHRAEVVLATAGRSCSSVCDTWKS